MSTTTTIDIVDPSSDEEDANDPDFYATPMRTKDHSAFKHYHTVSPNIREKFENDVCQNKNSSKVRWNREQGYELKWHYAMDKKKKRKLPFIAWRKPDGSFVNEKHKDKPTWIKLAYGAAIATDVFLNMPFLFTQKYEGKLKKPDEVKQTIAFGDGGSGDPMFGTLTDDIRYCSKVLTEDLFNFLIENDDKLELLSENVAELSSNEEKFAKLMELGSDEGHLSMWLNNAGKVQKRVFSKINDATPATPAIDDASRRILDLPEFKNTISKKLEMFMDSQSVNGEPYRLNAMSITDNSGKCIREDEFGLINSGALVTIESTIGSLNLVNSKTNRPSGFHLVKTLSHMCLISNGIPFNQKAECPSHIDSLQADNGMETTNETEKKKKAEKEAVRAKKREEQEKFMQDAIQRGIEEGIKRATEAKNTTTSVETPEVDDNIPVVDLSTKKKRKEKPEADKPHKRNKKAQKEVMGELIED